jgi:hypothetical protein
LLHGYLRHSREWPLILNKRRCIANYKYLRMILNRQILSDADTPSAINFAANRRPTDSDGRQPVRCGLPVIHALSARDRGQGFDLLKP